ncbi:MAG: class I tRNA ligase family protein, partial [Longimicrobiales bacterium]
DTIKIAVQVNGKLRATVDVSAGSGQEEVEALARAQENVSRHLEGSTVRRVIFVQDRLLNFVVG